MFSRINAGVICIKSQMGVWVFRHIINKKAEECWRDFWTLREAESSRVLSGQSVVNFYMKGSVRQVTKNQFDEGRGEILYNEFVNEAIDPDFIKRFFYVKENCSGALFIYFSSCDVLDKPINLMRSWQIFPKAELFWYK